MEFVQIDLDLLRERFEVTERCERSRWINPVSVGVAVWKHDLVFCWFASWHALMPLLFARLMGVPSILVIGGYDLANMPEIGYGNQRGGLKKWLSRLAMRLATCLFTNSRYSQSEAGKNAGLDRKRVKVIYHGFDTSIPMSSGKREDMAITIGNVNETNLLRKGIEPFVRSAAFLPDLKFLVIGAWTDGAIDKLKQIATPNVVFTGFVSDEELSQYLARARVYVQASLHEGFGMAAAEAMLAGCVPVVTRHGALREVVEDTGVCARSNDPEDIAEGIQTALAMNGTYGTRARQRIVHEFPLDKRRNELFKLINDCLK